MPRAWSGSFLSQARLLFARGCVCSHVAYAQLTACDTRLALKNLYIITSF